MKAYRASIFHFLDKPVSGNGNYEFIEDGVLIVEDGKVKTLAPYSEIKIPPHIELKDFSGSLIMPGFIDSHIHATQTGAIASYGEHLLEWLQIYIYPAEEKYEDNIYAKKAHSFFLKELLRNGTTTGVIYSSVHKGATDLLFEEAERLNMRIIAGKVLMDGDAPSYLRDTAESGYNDSKELIEKWHGRGRLSYVVTPRFAVTCSKEQLKLASKLLEEFPGLYMQTHLSENINEVKRVKELFPRSKNYLDVYDGFGLLGPRSIFGHAIHLSEEEFERIHETNSVCAWCPTSNFFLGSGVFNLGKAREYNCRTTIATDVGAGTSFSMLRTLSEAYKGSILLQDRLKTLEAYYLITLGGARGLSIDDKIGNFEEGKEADFVVLDLKCTPLLEYRLERAETLKDKLFVIMMLGDDRIVKETYIYGKCLHKRD